MAGGGARGSSRELGAITSAARIAVALAILTLFVDFAIFDEPAVSPEELRQISERSGIPTWPPPTGPVGPTPTEEPTATPTGPVTATCLASLPPGFPTDRPPGVPRSVRWPPTCTAGPP